MQRTGDEREADSRPRSYLLYLPDVSGMIDPAMLD
jgi:hypothetical protein